MANQNDLRLTVNARFHNRNGCPVVVKVDHPGISEFSDRDVILTDSESGDVISAQCFTSDDGKSTTLAWILDGLAAGVSRTYTLSEGTVNDEAGVELKDESETIDITFNGRPFTTFRYGKGQYRPYFYPVLGPNGCEVTRGETSDISKDHVHHRSLYVAYGKSMTLTYGEKAKILEELYIKISHKNMVVPLLAEFILTTVGKIKMVKS